MTMMEQQESAPPAAAEETPPSSTTAEVVSASTAAHVTEEDHVEKDDDDDVVKQVDAAIETAASNAVAAATSLWSAFGSAVSSVAASSQTTINFSATTNNIVNKATHLIDQLEVEATRQDPHHLIKESLDVYLTDKPYGNYEEWIIKWIEHDHGGEQQQQGEEDGSKAVVELEPSYYADDSPHRKVWNERNHQDGIDINNEGEGGISTNAIPQQRKYVLSVKEKEDRLRQKEKQKSKETKPTPEAAAASVEEEDHEEEEVITFDDDNNEGEKPLLPVAVDSTTTEKVDPAVPVTECVDDNKVLAQEDDTAAASTESPKEAEESK